MERFRYIAYDKGGNQKQGEISASTMDSAKLKVKALELIPVKVEKFEASKSKFTDVIQVKRNPRLTDLEFFTAQFSMLLKNGIMVDRALIIAKEGVKNSILKKVISEVYEEIRRGTPLSHALEKYPKIFDPLYVSIVSIGEATGNLANVLGDLAEDLNFRQGIVDKTRQAMMYPLIILVICVLAVTFIFNFIVPRISVVFSGMKELPFYTELLLSVSAGFRQYQFFGLFIIIGLIIFLSQIRKWDLILRWRDMLILKVPLAKQLAYDLENLRFASSLAILLGSRVVLVDALEYAVRSVGNVFLRKKLSIIKEEIRQGKKLSEVMAKTEFLPHIFNNLIEVGEQTGRLAEMFSEMQKRLQKIYENRVTTLVTLIEPVMIIIMGFLVGSIIVVMLLSLVSISDISF